MIDVVLECTNLIVGSAKVIASAKGIDFTIATPKLSEDGGVQLNYIQSVQLDCSQGSLFIAMDENIK